MQSKNVETDACCVSPWSNRAVVFFVGRDNGSLILMMPPCWKNHVTSVHSCLTPVSLPQQPTQIEDSQMGSGHVQMTVQTVCLKDFIWESNKAIVHISDIIIYGNIAAHICFFLLRVCRQRKNVCTVVISWNSWILACRKGITRKFRSVN